jgi:hypothetical protein
MLPAAETHQKALSDNLFLSRDIYSLNQEISWLYLRPKVFRVSTCIN